MAIRYYVGGIAGVQTGWISIHFSATSGGAGGASIPGQDDDVVIDANSGPGGFRIGLSTATKCLGFDCSAANSFIMTDGALYPYGDIALSSGYDMRSVISCNGSDQTLKSNSCILKRDIVIACSGSFTLLDSFANGTSNSGIEHKAGVFDSGGFPMTLGRFCPYPTNPSLSRSIVLGDSVVVLNGAQLGVWDVAGSASIDAASATIRLIGVANTSGIDLKGGGFDYGWIDLRNGGGSVRIGGIASVSKLTFSGSATYQLSDNQNADQISADAGLGRLKIQSSASGTSRAVTAGEILALNNVDFRDIDAEGAAIPWTGTGLVDEGGNANINF